MTQNYTIHYLSVIFLLYQAYYSVFLAFHFEVTIPQPPAITTFKFSNPFTSKVAHKLSLL